MKRSDLTGGYCRSTSLSPYEVKPTQGYGHLKFGPAPSENVKAFAAYVSAFDEADDDGDGKADFLGFLKWVAYKLKGVNQDNAGQYREPNVSVRRTLVPRKGI